MNKKVVHEVSYIVVRILFCVMVLLMALAVRLDTNEKTKVEYTVIDKVQEIDIIFPDYYIILKSKNNLKSEEVPIEVYSDTKIGDKRYYEEYTEVKP